MKPAVRDGLIKIPSGVFRELCDKDDWLSRIISRWRELPGVEVQLKKDTRLGDIFAEVVTRYGEKFRAGNKTYRGLFSGPRGRRSADAEVIAVSKYYRYVAVSDDLTVKVICLQDCVDVECIPWTEFPRRLRIGPLFER